jgi:hypothetical protein
MNFLKNFFYYYKFIDHNKNYFKFYKKKLNKSLILCELHSHCSSHIPLSYFLNFFSNKLNSNILGYSIFSTNFFFKKIAWYVYKNLNFSFFGIFRSLGASSFFFSNPNSLQKRRAFKIFLKIKKKLLSKSDLEKLKINNILIGDLIYDDYLRLTKKPTINLKDKEFYDFLKYSIELYFFWEDYFSLNKVKALFVSHCVYLNAIPLRIAIKKKIPSYQVTYQSVYKLDNKNIFAYKEFLTYKNVFKTLTKKNKIKAIFLGKQLLKTKTSGKLFLDSSVSTKSGYHKSFTKYKILKNTNRIKVLILTHCFFDSPHSYGRNLFPDFYEWLNFIGKLSKKTNYDWYIKLHPDYINGTKKIILDFLFKYNNITLIPENISHHQIISEGINFILTVYGTAGSEYPFYRIPVINASLNNPHIMYKFNFHPRTINEYKKLLLNLENIYLNYNKDEIYQYYYMKNIYYWDNWLGLDYRNLVKKLGGYHQQFTPSMYELWLHIFAIKKHQKIFKTVKNFIYSKDYILSKKHFTK